MAGSIGPVAGDREHPIGGKADLADVLLGGKQDTMSALPIPGLIDDEYAAAVGTEGRMCLPEL